MMWHVRIEEVKLGFYTTFLLNLIYFISSISKYKKSEFGKNGV